MSNANDTKQTKCTSLMITQKSLRSTSRNKGKHTRPTGNQRHVVAPEMCQKTILTSEDVGRLA